MERVMIAALVLAGPAVAQQKRELRSTIVYIAGGTVYLNAGRLVQISPGDTAFVLRGNSTIGSLVVTAIADRSSAAHIIVQYRAFAIGDTVAIALTPRRTKPEISTPEKTAPVASNSHAASPPPPRINVLSGRVALQYNMVIAEDHALNLNQPAAVLQLNVGNLLGAGMNLKIYGVSFLDGNGAYALYGNRAGLQNNIYQMSLTGETLGSSFGYGIGRLNSPFVSGLGTFDGGEIYYRFRDLTVGAIGGAAAAVPASTLGFSGTKTAAFVNYHSRTDIFHQFDGTIAYGLRMVNGNLDRNYLYLQNSLSLGTDMSFYESTEIDMSKPSNGTHRPGFSFSNTFFSMNYFPTNWLFANIGYDAYRNIYLFETMKSIPDSLIDRNILQGFRADVTVYLPGSITISANGSYDTRRDFVRSEHTLGGSVRSSDLFGIGLDASVRYTNMLGIYSNANDVTLELDRTLFDAVDLSVSYEYYNISVSILEQTYKTQTISGFLDYTFSQTWYSSLGLNDVIDPSMNSFRVYGEIGFRF